MICATDPIKPRTRKLARLTIQFGVVVAAGTSVVQHYKSPRNARTGSSSESSVYYLDLITGPYKTKHAEDD